MFKQKPIKPKSHPHVLHEKEGKNVEAEASMFPKYTPIGNRKQKPQETLVLGKTSKVVKTKAKEKMHMKKKVDVNNKMNCKIQFK